MTTYVSTPERARQTPAGQLRHRIRQLEQLAARVDDELTEARHRLHRLEHPPRRPGMAVVPRGVDSARVRTWARLNGWPTLGDRGRLPAAAIDAFLTAHPGVHR